MTREFCIDIDEDHNSVRITVGKEVRLLHAGEWSDWVRIQFDAMPPFKKLPAMCRFYLKSVAPSLELYVSPLNIDPEHPALPISTPPGYARDLSRRVGPYYTLGIAEDTKALEAGVFDDAEFVTQTDTLLAERDRMLDAVLSDYRGGLLFFYISTIDQSCHALWRNGDPAHPAHAQADTTFAGRFRVLYEDMDAMLGKVRARVGENATIIVLSDHGFAPYYKKVHLNTWLYQNGYLALVRPDEIGQHPLFDNVFWRKTRAYAAGFNGLYVNLVGREGKGIVSEGKEYDDLINELSAKLLTFRDPENGEPVITEVVRARDVFHGSRGRARAGPHRGVQSWLSLQRRFGARHGDDRPDHAEPRQVDGRSLHGPPPGARHTGHQSQAHADRAQPARSARHHSLALRCEGAGADERPRAVGRRHQSREVIMFGKKGIQLDPALMEKVRAAAAKAGYASPDEFVAHVLEKELSRSDDASHDADVKKKLEGLGYIS